MKLVTFSHNHFSRFGAVVGDEVVDGVGETNMPGAMINFISAGEAALQAMHKRIASGNHRIPLAEVKLQAPIPRPGKYLAISLNYADHIAETGRDRPEFPSFFTKKLIKICWRINLS